MPFGWVGDGASQTDADTGLVLMGHRVYDSRLGRFLSQDPIGDGGNWYAYCDNNPVNLSDPMGLRCPAFDSTGMGNGQIYDYVTANGGLPGESYETKDGKGNIVFQFMVSGFSLGGSSAVAPYGFNVGQDVAAARRYYQSPQNQRGGKFDPSKAGAYLAANYRPGNKHGDPKIYGKQYDHYGHVIYAIAGSELRVKLRCGIQADSQAGAEESLQPPGFRQCA